MTTPHDHLGQLRDDWRWRCHRHASIIAMAQIRERHPDDALADLSDLGELVVALDVGGGRSVIERARIAQILLIEATNEEVRRALLQALLPGVVSTCRQLRFGQGIINEPHECVAAAISMLNDLISDWAGESRPYAAPDLLSALRGRLRRWLLKEKGSRLNAPRADDPETPAATNSALLTRLEILVEGPHERLARLTYRCVFAGIPLRELAREDQSSLPSLRRELQIFALAHLLG